MKNKKRKPRKKYRVSHEEEPTRKLMLVNGKPIYEIGKFISKTLAKKWVANYRKKENNARKIGPTKKVVNSHLFGKGKVLDLINQPDCHALRIYYATDKDKRGNEVPKLLLVGVYKNGNDMIEHTLILDHSYPCPEMCENNGL